jgi:adenylosuccinate synthase
MEIAKQICIAGAQYGSEGKAAASEYWIRQMKQVGPSLRIVVIGENGPNSGHTCSAGSVRSFPAATFWADIVMLGPDSAINPTVFAEDMTKLCAFRKRNNMDMPHMIIHENAAIVDDINLKADVDSGNIKSVSSTGSGAGHARLTRSWSRDLNNTIRRAKLPEHYECVQYASVNDWLQLVAIHRNCHLLFECSQGMMLDIMWGRYPYCTSRNTSPRIALERCGVGHLFWTMVAVMRTYPIRTGGPSGDCDGAEIQFEDLNLPPETTTVTKRKRRIFKFSRDETFLASQLIRPTIWMITHVDYLTYGKQEPEATAIKWIKQHRLGFILADSEVYASSAPADFVRVMGITKEKV